VNSSALALGGAVALLGGSGLLVLARRRRIA
jgi:LPXTG-motif cell wall-anchored protein